MTLFIIAAAIAIVQGWIVTDPQGIGSPVFEPIRKKLGKKSRQNKGLRPDDFDWPGFIAHKLVCRPCSGVELPALYAVVVADDYMHGFNIWVVSLLVNLAYNETLQAISKGRTQ